ncbi:hypothetical protein [Shewanella sp. YIC-542]|uniref:hypothetical protein n=1 Tax=Shewanella mytili TaxID=3377111 RepID=UPI00398E51A8
MNQIKVNGSNALDDTLKTVAGWLKELTKRHFTPEELKISEDYIIGRQKVRTYNASQAEPLLYSILFSNPDSEVHGRQWITEIGIRVESDGVLFTTLLETSDISTQVTDIPQSSRPKVIKYLQNNCNVAKDTVGLSLKNISNDEDLFRALLSELERPERKHPVVLVSSDSSGKPLLNPRSLQEQLIGLAQVVVCDQSVDSWEMERVLGRRYSAWGGAINVIFPIRNRSVCPRRLLLVEHLEELKSNDKYLIGEILSIVTHTTNGYRKRLHFSPTDVRAKRQKDHREFLKQKYSELQQSGDYEELLNEAFEQIDSYDSTIEALKDEHQQIVDSFEIEKMELEEINESLSEKIRSNSYTISELKRQLGSANSGGQALDAELIQILSEALSHDPSPEQCLKLVEAIYPSRIVVLDSALASARDSISFGQGRKLIGLLFKLSTEYIDVLSQGGDSKAKEIFGKLYSANESETVEKSPELSKLRQFTYNGEDIYMFKHLRIGVADNITETIRVHFHWDSKKSTIVIGYCGPHLPIGSKSH